MGMIVHRSGNNRNSYISGNSSISITNRICMICMNEYKRMCAMPCTPQAVPVYLVYALLSLSLPFLHSIKYIDIYQCV